MILERRFRLNYLFWGRNNKVKVTIKFMTYYEYRALYDNFRNKAY